MDKYLKYFPRLRGGDVRHLEPSPAQVILHNEIFGIDTPSVFWIKVAGVWKQATGYIKVSGVWKEVTPIVRVSGTWY